jgi:hypothetical protein
MVNNTPRQVLLLCWTIAALFLLSSPTNSYGDQETLGDLSEMQQDIRWLKSTIEQLKLQRELEILRPISGKTQKICQPGSGLGTLSLNMLYRVNQQFHATLTYNAHTQVTARRGEQLLCGETILNITLEGVELEKQGQRYRITGQVATLLMPSSTLPASTESTHAP